MAASAVPDPLRIAYAHARQLGLSREDAQECALDFRLHLLRCRAPQLESAAWLNRCASNFVRNVLRAEVRRREREREYRDRVMPANRGYPEAVFAGPGPRTLTLRKALWEQVVAILSGFTPEQRSLFLNYHIRQHSLAELAQKSGRTLAATTQALYHIHRRLVRLLLEKGWSAADARQVVTASCPPKLPRARP